MEGGRLRYLAPSGALSPGLMASLSQQTREIGELLNGSGPITRVAGAGPVPQSFAQQRIWALSNLFPESAAYHIAEKIEPAEPFVHGALARTFNEIVWRHAILRTTFTVTPAGPGQVIAEPVAISVPIVDLRDVLGQVREAEAERC
jgi:hypothetical protein